MPSPDLPPSPHPETAAPNTATALVTTLVPYVAAAAASALTVLLCQHVLGFFELANIAMVLLLTVLLVAVQYGRGPSVLATCLNVAAFDYFFVAPRFTFAISDLQYMVTFVVMLAVGLITGHLTADLRFQARVAASRELRWRALYEFSGALSGTLLADQVFDITSQFVARTFGARAALLLPGDDEQLVVPAGAGSLGDVPLPAQIDMALAQWAYDQTRPAGLGTETQPGSDIYYLPLQAPMRTRGVLAIEPAQRRWIMVPEQRQQLDTFAALAAIALERVHYIEVAQQALVSMESERLRNSLLQTLSHDLRTPLTLLVGMSESLAAARPPLPPQMADLASTMHGESLRMNALVTNLLDMARIQSGGVHLRLEWHAMEELAGSALRGSALQLNRHQTATSLPVTLPLVQCDGPLVERVLCNLLENAAKYTPAGSIVTVAATTISNTRGEWLEVAVRDNGPGLPLGREAELFEKFARGEQESATPGVGLGLAICQAIIEAHGGKVGARQAAGGGAEVYFALKLAPPPSLPPEDAEAFGDGAAGEDGVGTRYE